MIRNLVTGELVDVTSLSFIGADNDIIDDFKLVEPEISTIIDQMESRCPWYGGYTKRLWKEVANNGVLKPETRMDVMQKYIDTCVLSEDEIAEQVATRKLIIRLLRIKDWRITIGYEDNQGNWHDQFDTREFLQSVYRNTEFHPLSAKQIEVVQRISARNTERLARIPLLTDEEFDGWEEVVVGSLTRHINGVDK